MGRGRGLEREAADGDTGWQAGGPAGAPGRRTLAQDLAPRSVAETAERGVAGAGQSMPHGDAIRRSFGPYTPALTAHVGGAAAGACEELGAAAYATGMQVAFGAEPDLHTAAHEAAHTVQQAGGVRFLDGAGSPGDRFEDNADQVAARVVAGEPAHDLLAEWGLPRSAPRGNVQLTLRDAAAYAKKVAKARANGKEAKSDVTFESLQDVSDYATTENYSKQQRQELAKAYARPIALPTSTLGDTKNDLGNQIADGILTWAGVADEAGLHEYIWGAQQHADRVHEAWAHRHPGGDSYHDIFARRVVGGEHRPVTAQSEGLRDGKHAVIPSDTLAQAEKLRLGYHDFALGRPPGLQEANLVTGLIRASGKDGKHASTATRDIVQNGFANFYSSGMKIPDASQVRPASTEWGVTKDADDFNLGSQTSRAPTKPGANDAAFQSFTGGYAPRMNYSQDSALQSFVQQVTNEQCLYRNRKTSKVQEKFQGFMHKHSEPAAALAMMGNDDAIATWLEQNFSTVTDFIIELHSDREVCWNCATCWNALISGFGQHMPRTWALLKGPLQLELFPRVVIGCSFPYNSNNLSTPMQQSSNDHGGAVTVKQVDDGKIVMVGDPGNDQREPWHQHDLNSRLRTPVNIIPPTNKTVKDHDDSMDGKFMQQAYGDPVAETLVAPAQLPDLSRGRFKRKPKRKAKAKGPQDRGEDRGTIKDSSKAAGRQRGPRRDALLDARKKAHHNKMWSQRDDEDEADDEEDEPEDE